MFEVRIMCEDSKLHKVLWALDGLIVGMPQMLPVRNAVASKDKTQVKEKEPGASSIMSKLREAVTDGSADTITWVEIANLAVRLGAKNRTSTSAHISRLEKEGILKKVSRGTYKVVSE